MTPSPKTPQENDSWLRWLPVWHSVFYILLASAMIISFTDKSLSQDESIIVITLTILLAGWYGHTVRSHPETIMGYPLWLSASYFLIGWLLWFALGFIHGMFMLLLFTLYPHVFMFSRLRWAIAGAFVISLMSGVHMDLFNGESGFVILIWMTLATGGAGLLGYFIYDIIQQSSERRNLITQLEETQANLVQAERQAGILEERGRLASEIHDTLAQGFVSIVMHLEAVDNAFSTEKATLSPTASKHLGQAKQVARDNISEARRFVWDLRPDILDGDSFDHVMRDIVRKWSSMYTIPNTVTITGDSYSLDDEQEVVLLRITQEALTNIHKHAKATAISLTLSYTASTTLLDIWDNGVGFNADGDSQGYGLISMRKRAESIGGELTIESEVGEGTTLAVQLPRTQQAEQPTND